MELIERFKEAVKKISKDDRVAVIHDADADGICSGVIAAKAIEILRKKPVDLIYTLQRSEIEISYKILQMLNANNINKLIITDAAVDQNPEAFKKIEDFAEIIVIDHHKILEDLNPDKTVFIKSQMIRPDIDGSQYPASKLIYDLISDVVNIKHLEWIAAIGVISDASYKTWKEFVDRVLEKYNFEFKDNIFETEFGKIVSLVSYSESLKDQNACFQSIYNSADPKELKRKIESYEVVEHEITYWVDNHKDFAEFIPDIDLIIYELSPKYNLKSIIINKLSFELYPNKTVIGISKHGERVTVSARRQDFKVPVNDLLADAIKDLPSSTAGGHIPAAGASFRKKDLKRFKDNIKQLLKTKYKVTD